MKVGWRKYFFRIAVDVEGTVTLEDDNIVVDTEVGVIEVFVFATNFNEAAIRQLRGGAAKSLLAPDRTTSQIMAVESGAGAPGRDAGANHCVPQLNLHLLRVFVAKPWRFSSTI